MTLETIVTSSSWIFATDGSASTTVNFLLPRKSSITREVGCGFEGEEPVSDSLRLVVESAAGEEAMMACFWGALKHEEGGYGSDEGLEVCRLFNGSRKPFLV